MSLMNETQRKAIYGVPRASGDEPRHHNAVAMLMECSPRERG